MEKNKIFISHRHSDTQSDCHRIKSDLQKIFGKDQVFLDIENLEPGIKFAEAITKTLAQSKVVLVVIGPDWLTVTNDKGEKRLFDPKDWVRREVAASLESPDTRVIPVLVKDAEIPNEDDLPDDLKSLTQLQVAEITTKRWDYDLGELVKVLERLIPHSEPEPQPFPRPTYNPAPPKKPKTWWQKNYLWLLGGTFGFIFLLNMCTTEDVPIEPIDEDQQMIDNSQDPRTTNPDGNEIYDDLKLTDESDRSETGTVNIIYVGDNYGCMLNIKINIAGHSIIPSGSQYTVSGIPLGNQPYSIEGQISCQSLGNCSAAGEGRVYITEGANLYIGWQQTAVGQCSIELVVQ